MNVDTEGWRLLGEAGLADRSPLVDDAAEYLRRTRRGRRYGLIGGLVLGFGPLAGDPEFSLVFPRMLVGYVLGLLISELLTPRRERSAHRAADLRVRRARDLLPGWAQVTVWLLFLPAFAAPLLALAHPVPGLARVSMPGYSCAAGPGEWPGLAALATAAAIGAAGLLAAQLTLNRLARRPRPADDPEGARLDDFLRGMSARAVAGGAAALALALAAGVSEAVYVGAHDVVCPARPGAQVPAYPWAASLTPWLQWASLGLLATAFLILALFRYRPDPRHRPVPGTAR